MTSRWCGPPYGSISTGSGVPGTWSRGQQRRRPRGRARHAVEASATADDRRRLGVRRRPGAAAAVAACTVDRQRPARRRPLATTSVPPARTPVWYAAALGEPLGGAAGRPAPELPLGRVVGAPEQHAVVVDRRRHGLDLHSGRGRRPRRRPPAAGAVESAVAPGGRRAAGPGRRRRVDPDGSSVCSGSSVVAPVAGSTASTCGLALVARHHLQRRSRPADQETRGEVGEGGAVPRDVGAAAVEAQDVQRHLGVGAAGHRVARPRWPAARGLAGSAMYQRCTGRLVDPRGEHGVAVGGPPVAAVAAHLLGGHELGHAPGTSAFSAAASARGSAPSTPTTCSAPSAA